MINHESSFSQIVFRKPRILYIWKATEIGGEVQSLQSPDPQTLLENLQMHKPKEDKLLVLQRKRLVDYNDYASRTPTRQELPPA